MAKEKMNIKSWSLEDRPREKMLLKGKEALSDAELIAILLGSGSREKTAVELAKEILKAANNNLHILSKTDLIDLMLHKGVGEAKAISISAALELGRRRQLANHIARPLMSGSEAIFKLMWPNVGDLKHEEFWVLLMDNSLRLMAKKRIGIGGVTSVVADKKIIFQYALKNLATAIAIVHNHPSGNLVASRQDKQLTEEVSKAAKLLDIQLVDHVIVTQEGYYSFADEGII